jgi:predicted aconitase
MDYKMTLTPEQVELLNGSKGETVAKVMKTLVMYGDAFDAEKMVPVTSEKGHLVTSFGLKVMKPVYDLMDQLIDAGAVSSQKFTVDPKPLDPNVPANFLENIVFKKFMYTMQDSYDAQLNKLGLIDKNSYTCTCYMDEVGNKPKKGDILSWAESSAVVYANSVLGARCNRNSGIIELMGSIAGFVPYFGLLTDEGRKATWIIEVKTTKKPEAQILGSAIGMKVMEDVPFVKGLDKWIGTELNDDACAYLKDFGAATASNGAVGLYHIENLTPEAVELGEKLIAENAKVYVIDDAELERVKNNYPIMWKKKEAPAKLCFVGCPHLSLAQVKEWTDNVSKALKKNGLSKVSVPTVFTAAPGVIEEFNKTPYAAKLKETGIVLSYICPLMYMNNPLCKKKNVITNSNKLRTYTTARYCTSDEILNIITTKGGMVK